MKYLLLFLILFTSSLSLADTLTLMNWEEYISEDVIQAWEEKSGHTLKQVYFDNDEDRDSALLNHKDRIIDLVVVDELSSRQFGEKGMFLPVKDFKNTDTIKNIDPDQQKICGNYSLPYLWGTFGLVYRTDKFESAPSSWNFVFTPPESAKGHIGFIDDFTDTLAPALITLKKSINTADQSELRQAFELTKQALPHILTFTYNISFADSLKEKDNLYAALAYSGDQYSLNSKYGEEVWEYTTLNEGTIHWVDCIAIRQDSPRIDIALSFIKYLYDPVVAAKNSEDVYVATPIPEAKKLQSAEFIADRTVYPEQSIMEKAQSYGTLSPENTLLRNRITSSLIKLHESK